VLKAGQMEKLKDLSDFDKGQTVMARRQAQSISKMAYGGLFLVSG